jgi:hypothetical protein
VNCDIGEDDVCVLPVGWEVEGHLLLGAKRDVVEATAPRQERRAREQCTLDNDDDNDEDVAMNTTKGGCSAHLFPHSKGFEADVLHLFARVCVSTLRLVHVLRRRSLTWCVPVRCQSGCSTP